MNTPSIQVSLASPDQQPVVAQLMELYIYDFSELLGLDLKNDGRFGYEPLPLYWKEPNRRPFLVWVDQKLAGFALVQRGSPIEADLDPDVWDMAQFFILRKFRRAGAGQTAASWIWSNHPGRWQIRVLAANDNANSFWESAISSFTKTAAHPLRRRIHEKDWLVYQFESPT